MVLAIAIMAIRAYLLTDDTTDTYRRLCSVLLQQTAVSVVALQHQWHWTAYHPIRKLSRVWVAAQMQIILWGYLGTLVMMCHFPLFLMLFI